VSGGRPLVERDGRGRRLRELDRHGTPVATLAWGADDRLAEAAVRLPDGAWLGVTPRAGRDAAGGVADVVHRDGAALTIFGAIDWSAIDAIPALAEPVRLPAGGGTAILNLIATLADEQRRGPLAYRGPYPTEQLFLALLQSFEYERAPMKVGWGEAPPPTAPPGRVAPEDPYDSTTAHPLELFCANRLVWRPAPHQRTFDPAGVYVQSRGRVERVVWRQRTYVRADWQGVALRLGHRLRDAGERVVASLWALEAPLEDHVILTRDGDVVETRAPAAVTEAARPLPPATAAGLVAAVTAASAAPLATAIRAAAGELAFEWAPLAGDLAVIDDGRARVSTTLLRALAARLAATTDRAAHVRLGFAALAEAAHALGDDLRARGQARLAAAGAGEQAAALREATAGQDDGTTARLIGAAVEQMLAEAAQLRA
jgi:hypothetical protein